MKHQIREKIGNMLGMFLYFVPCSSADLTQLRLLATKML